MHGGGLELALVFLLAAVGVVAAAAVNVVLGRQHRLGRDRPRAQLRRQRLRARRIDVGQHQRRAIVRQQPRGTTAH